ncbi:hypothetical protein BS50DRAFT_588308 [Corynespora cassiicola Philippines]|uniref:Uncharacterized protein n=1 Tax=Corynespora cassiicola Philippines TaxID=1448308 RepID=A0A2T2NPH5_CORCC|nr:hypothetical protein BS50DRAFT_588308 [Corynespora cassiicola Philippines]
MASFSGLTVGGLRGPLLGAAAKTISMSPCTIPANDEQNMSAVAELAGSCVNVSILNYHAWAPYERLVTLRTTREEDMMEQQQKREIKRQRGCNGSVYFFETQAEEASQPTTDIQKTTSGEVEHVKVLARRLELDLRPSAPPNASSAGGKDSWLASTPDCHKLDSMSKPTNEQQAISSGITWQMESSSSSPVSNCSKAPKGHGWA